MTDRLTLTRAFEGAGIASDAITVEEAFLAETVLPDAKTVAEITLPQAAERIATEIFDAIHENVATKADIELIRADLERAEAALLRADLMHLEAGLVALRNNLEHQITRMTIRLGIVVVAVAGLASTIVHFWR